MQRYYYTSSYKDNYWMIWFNEIYEAFYGFKHHFVWLRYKNNEIISDEIVLLFSFADHLYDFFI